MGKIRLAVGVVVLALVIGVPTYLTAMFLSWPIALIVAASMAAGIGGGRYLAAQQGGGSGSGGGQPSRRRQSKGARSPGTRDDR